MGSERSFPFDVKVETGSPQGNLSAESLGGKFVYVQNNPVEGTDPNGEALGVLDAIGVGMVTHSSYNCFQCNRCTDELDDYIKECTQILENMCFDDWLNSGNKFEFSKALECALAKMGKGRTKKCASYCAQCIFITWPTK